MIGLAESFDTNGGVLTHFENAFRTGSRMTTGDQDSLPPPERLTVALLGQRLDVIDIKDVWEKLGVPETLDSIASQEAPLKIKRAAGNCEFGTFEFHVQSDRAALTLAPRLVANLGTGFPRIMRLENFDKSYEWITNLASALIDAMPTLQRVGVHASFVYDFDTADASASFIRSKLLFVSDDAAAGEDFIYQINRPVPVAPWLVNRVWTWQAARANGILISDSKPVAQQFWMIRVAFDINNNTDAAPLGTLEPQKCQQLLTTLSSLVRPFVHENV
jgi:hypothetical protein